jgi:hypothetical protein
MTNRDELLRETAEMIEEMVSWWKRQAAELGDERPLPGQILRLEDQARTIRAHGGGESEG